MATFGGATDPQRQILSLIRDFAAERSHEERRVFDLKKRLRDLQSEFESSASSLADAKRSRDDADRALKASETELSMAENSILSQQARARVLQDAIAGIGGDVAGLKAKEVLIRDEFIGAMFDLNKKIRKFQESFIKSADNSAGILPCKGEQSVRKEASLSICGLKNVEDEIASINHQINDAQREYHEALREKDEVLQMLTATERRVQLIEAVMEEMKQLQDLGQQTSETEKSYAYLGEELKKKYTCPGCGVNNMGQL